MSEKTPVSEDEIDLGQVFKFIGNFFQSVSNLIKSIFVGIFSLFIRLLLLIKDNFIKFLIVGASSFIAGFVIDYNSQPTFSSEMNIQPNFNSTNKMYSNISYYNGLIEANDSLKLASVFGITEEAAASLKKLSIHPIRDENEMLQKYDSYRTSILDTINTPEVGYSRFKMNINPVEFTNHFVYAESTDPLIFSKIEDSIIYNHALLNDKYLVINRNKELKNFQVQEAGIIRQQKEIDSLRSIYSKVMLKSAEKSSTTGTSIQLAATQTQTNELDLFHLEAQAKEQRKVLNSDMALKNDMINIISGFQDRGLEVEKDLIDLNAVLFLIIALSGLFLFLFLKSLNTYLINYKNKMNV